MNTKLGLLFIMIFLSISKSDYVLYEITAFNPRERDFLYNMQSKISSVIFLNGVSNEASIPMNVVVNKTIYHMFEGSMRSLDIQCNRVAQIKSEHLLSYQKNSSVSTANITDTFYDWDEILKWIERKINKKFKKVVVAKSYEKRDIFFLKTTINRKKPIVFIVGGEEGMDWISSAVILNLLNDLLDNVDELKMLMANFNFYFMPILNPDGFAYSKEQDRFWSKNRRKLDTETKCKNKNEPIGVTIARNWFYQKKKRVGEECNSVYIGHRPISEEENQGLSYVLNNLALNMIAFINVRGFGQYITVPYADVSAKINNHDIVMEILKAAGYKVRIKHNTTFDIRTTSNYFYNFTGNMADWVKNKLNTPLVYTVYLEDIFNILPHPKNIKKISKQFYTILNESLLITKDIYGPLFSDEIKAPINYLLFNTIFVLQLLLLTNV